MASGRHRSCTQRLYVHELPYIGANCKRLYYEYIFGLQWARQYRVRTANVRCVQFWSVFHNSIGLYFKLWRILVYVDTYTNPLSPKAASTTGVAVISNTDCGWHYDTPHISDTINAPHKYRLLIYVAPPPPISKVGHKFYTPKWP